jgi:DNA-3-methyladenine glycosylase II
MTIANEETLRQASGHLAAHDPILAPVIKSAGPCTITPHKNYYQELVDSIISQQLSVKAARSIEQRFIALFNDAAASDEDDRHANGNKGKKHDGSAFPPPEKILEKSAEALRTAGLSTAKANYVRDLAQKVVDGTVKFDHLDSLSNDQVIAELTAVKGIGLWTVHMFLMFCMGRLDVLATGDLGIKNGIQRLYGLDHAPDPREIEELAENNGWSPYQSVACWYIWRSLDNMPI